MVVFGAGPGEAAGDGDADGEADDPGEAAGDGDGDGVGSGSAPAILPDAAQPARTSPAAANRAATSADLNLIDHQRTGTSDPVSYRRPSARV